MSDVFKHLKDNKKALIEEKKFSIKCADPISYHVTATNEKGETVKASLVQGENPTALIVKAVINTTNIIDSHMDLHVPGIWKKSLKEKKEYYLLQEHQMKFDKIITDQVKAATESMLWKELNQKLDGSTEALIFDCEIDPERNEYMFEQYLRGYVKNHSVGMRYVQLFLCLNSDEKYYKEEKEYWDKYYPMVANKEVADESGYFWAVTEAKIIEGSAVPIGSNTATPTMSVTPKNIEAVDDTSNQEPSNDTQKTISKIYSF